MERKGITGIEIAVIGTIAMFVAIASLVIFVVFLKVHLVRVLEIQYGYNNAGLTLLELLSDENVYEKLGSIASGMEDDAWKESVLKSRLDKLVPGGCYQLSLGTNEILHPNNCDISYVASTYIILPYNENAVEKVTIGIPRKVTFIQETDAELASDTQVN